MRFDRKKIASILLLAGIFFIAFITFNLLLSATLFIFNISIQKWYAIASVLLSALLVIVLLKNKNNLNLKTIIYTIIIPLISICGLTYVNGKVYDYTYDGNSYHKLAIGMMMDGWNPLKETEYEFNEHNENAIELEGIEFQWGDYYAKASHIFSANIGVMTGNVESGKVINDISIISLFLFVLAICLYIGKKVWFSILFSVIMATSTTIMSQVFTNYVDLLVYLYMFLLITLFFWFEYVKEFRKETFISLFMVLIILINIKFSSFAYAGILCTAYYGWYIYRFRKDKKFDKKFFKNFTIVAIAAVLVGVFVVGLSVYPKNFVTHGHPFYPLMGEGRVDIMTKNSPDYFKEKNNLQKIFITTFSKMDNISEADGKKANYKIPFTIDAQEIEHAGDCDLRISGNGGLFGGIIIISIIVIVCYSRKLYRDDKKLFAMIFIPLTMTIVLATCMSDVWWARYFPQLHFFVFAALIILDKYQIKKMRVILYIICAVIITNNMITFVGAFQNTYKYTKETKQFVAGYKNTFSNKDCKILLSSNLFPGGFYNVRNDFREYEIEYEKFDEETLDYIPVVMNYVKGRCYRK